jgi:hypothetical protein
MTKIGKMPVSQVLPYLVDIAEIYGLRLNRVKEWRMARAILVSRYSK